MIQDKINQTVQSLAQLDAIKSRDSSAMAEANRRALEAMQVRIEQLEAIQIKLQGGINNGGEE